LIHSKFDHAAVLLSHQPHSFLKSVKCICLFFVSVLDWLDIAEAVAAMTESELGVESEKAFVSILG
jgi:hypothetical protein